LRKHEFSLKWSEERIFFTMGLGTTIAGLVKGKALVTTVLGITLVGGATAAAAASPTGQQMLSNLTLATHQAVTPTAQTNNAQKANNGTGQECPGQSEVEKLLQKYGLSTNEQGNAVKTGCALHNGTYKGTTSKNESVTSDKHLGYGEVDQALTYAKYLAEHASAGGKLTDDNVSTYVADALKSCGATPFAKCLKDNIPGYQPGQGQDTGNSGDNGNKPTSTPTPAGNKPEATPTPHKPTGTPTPPTHS
jgi:osmotically-inducible protein OsmY